MEDLLFVYGSLLTEGNEFAGYLSSNAQLICDGNFKGMLYDIGEYPGAVIDKNTDQKIHGSVYKLNHPKIALRMLDDYEGFGAEQEQPNLFIRELLNIDIAKGAISCWVYLYNLPTEGLSPIPSGNYQQYLKTKA